jgi:hypothetical protein
MAAAASNCALMSACFRSVFFGVDYMMLLRQTIISAAFNRRELGFDLGAPGIRVVSVGCVSVS